MPSEEAKRIVKDAVLADPEFAQVNSVSKALYGIDLVELIHFYMEHGEFATQMLIQSRVQSVHIQDDFFLNGIKELAADKEFMKGMPEQLRRQVFTAVGNA